MPAPIKKITSKFLTNPIHVKMLLKSKQKLTLHSVLGVLVQLAKQLV
jgi:hypothetical protein